LLPGAYLPKTNGSAPRREHLAVGRKGQVDKHVLDGPAEVAQLAPRTRIPDADQAVEMARREGLAVRCKSHIGEVRRSAVARRNILGARHRLSDQTAQRFTGGQ